MSFITIDTEKCIQDRICVSECPVRIIRMDSHDEYPVPVSGSEDIRLKCGHCVTVCPAGALSLEWLNPEDCKSLNKELYITPEQAEQFLSGRRSIRTFKEKKVPRETLRKLLEIACSAPSAKNRQPWHWIVVEEPAEVQRLVDMIIERMRSAIRDKPAEAEAMGYQGVVALREKGYDRICRNAPHMVIVHAEKDWIYGIEDCALALGHLDLYATTIGLGTCWAGTFYKAVNAYPSILDYLGVPSHHAVFGAMMVGYPRFHYQRIPVRNPPQVTWK